MINFLNKNFNNPTIIPSPESKWAEDLFREMVEEEGYSPFEAIERLKRSPFFNPKWIEEKEVVESVMLTPFDSWVNETEAACG